ncbi:MAG: TIGR03560 family F420-dependent LLM class oxidoreductase [Chloroflexi bacterium]|nr:TIGR03560 family F420-dependent LLM class oxidoreductase [Chloroflexota bacterium]
MQTQSAIPEIAIMVEGQMGLTWPRWQRMARAVEDLGFVGLYRSDHFTNAEPPDEDSLELWTSLTWLADRTERIEFGPLVAPVSFRHPAMLVRMAASVQELSGGRLTLGVGAGWMAREHRNFSYDLLGVRPRFDRLEEALTVITRLLAGERVTFSGAYYDFEDAILLPLPERRVPILIGGNGLNRTLSFAARFADEWNGIYLTPEAFTKRTRRLDTLLQQQGRAPESVRRSIMTGLTFGHDDADVRRQLNGRSPDDARATGRIAGTASEVKDQLAALAEAGVQRVMLQYLDYDDLSRLEAFAAAVL